MEKAEAKKTETKPFDPAAFEYCDTAVVGLLDPLTGDEIPGATIEVYGPDSEHFQTATTKMRARITNFLSRNQGAKGEQKQTVMDGYERDRNISCIKSINGVVCTGPRDACDRFNWIYRQATAAIDNQSNFIKGSSAK